MVILNRDAYIPKGVPRESKLSFVDNLKPGTTINGTYMKIAIDFDHLYDDFLLDLKEGTLVHKNEVIDNVQTF